MLAEPVVFRRDGPWCGACSSPFSGLGTEGASEWPSDCARAMRGEAGAAYLSETSVSAEPRRAMLGGRRGDALRGDGGCRGGGSSNVTGRGVVDDDLGDSGRRSSSSSISSCSSPTLAGGLGGGGPILTSSGSWTVEMGRFPGT
jgi:hypothetical protein